MSLELKTYDADGTCNPYRFAKPGAAIHEVAQASADTDKVKGIIQNSAAILDGNPVDIAVRGDDALLEFGDTVADGDLLMPDADGKGIPATSGKRYGALALEPGVAGDIRKVRCVFGTV